MRRTSRMRQLLLCSGGLLALLGTIPAFAQANPGLSPSERREALRPVYEKVKADASLRALEPGRLGRFRDEAALETYLKAMPLSPLDYLRIDMYARRYDMMIPRHVQEWHLRWMRLHEAEARKLYGDDEVDARLFKSVPEPPPEAVSAEEAAVSADNAAKGLTGNRNVAALNFPGPEEYQGEIQIVANPANPDQLVAAANTWDAPAGCGDGTIAIFYSGNAGAGWGYTCAPDSTAYAGFGACPGGVFGSDPALAWNANGEVFLNYMLLCGVSATETWFSLVVARSADGGATWTPQGVVKNSWPTPNQVEDKNFYTIDRTTTSPYNGRHYTCWDRNNDEKFAYSTNNGATWTEVDLPSPGVGTFDIGCDIAVDKTGSVHVIFNNHQCNGFGCFNSRLYYVRSNDGGVTWTGLRQLRDYNLTEFSAGACPEAQDDRCIGTLGAIDVDRSGGACDGSIYVTYGDFDTGLTVEDTDVWVIRGFSLPGIFGTFWTVPKRANSGGLAEYIQFHPTLAVDQYDGELVVAWQDGRNHPNNKLMDTYYATSKDCAGTFSDFQLTVNSTEFNNSTRETSNENSSDNLEYNPNQYGEYMGLDVQGSQAFFAWTDTRHFYPNFTTESQKENVAFESRTLFKPAYLKTYYSIAGEDGMVQESTELSNVGDYLDLSVVGAGDNNLDEQRKAIVSFDTSAIPDAATIQSVRLRVRRLSVTGTSPFTTHGTLVADIKTGTFGVSALEVSDFEAASTALAVCTMSTPAANGDWSECTLTGVNLGRINKTGRTQFRLRFTTGDNDDLGYDTIFFYDGSALNGERPELVVTYL